MNTYVVEYQHPKDGYTEFMFFKSDLEKTDELKKKIQKYLNKFYVYFTNYVGIYSISTIEEWVEIKTDYATVISGVENV